MTRATRLFLAAICGRGDAVRVLKRVLPQASHWLSFLSGRTWNWREFDSPCAGHAIMHHERVPMFPAIACNLEIRRSCITHASGSTRESVCARIIIAVVVASREDPHPITGIVSASTSHRSTALNAASSCNDNDEADAHSRHSTHLDRRTHCLQLHMS